MIPFSVVWAGFALGWVSGVHSSHAPASLSLWGIPLIATAVYITVGRFFIDAFVRAQTKYLLTDRRALVLTTWPLHRVRSVNLCALQEIGLVHNGDGSGTIVFGSRPWSTYAGNASPRFEWIKDARRVSRLATSAQVATSLTEAA